MKCLSCGSSDVFIFLTEKIPCSNCDHYLAIHYCTCNSCGNIWRNIDGTPLEEKFMNNFTPIDTTDVEFDNFEEVSLEELEQSIKIIEKFCQEPENNTMSEMFHKCLRCNHIAYEVSKKCFQCPDCGFEWEVL